MVNSPVIFVISFVKRLTVIFILNISLNFIQTSQISLFTVPVVLGILDHADCLINPLSLVVYAV